MQRLIQELEALHATIVEVLDAGDVERLDHLVQQRGALMASLTAAHEAASPAQRDGVSGALQHLICLDQDLQARFRAQRDQLGGRLTDTRRSSHAQSPAPTVSGVLDRRA